MPEKKSATTQKAKRTTAGSSQTFTADEKAAM